MVVSSLVFTLVNPDIVMPDVTELFVSAHHFTTKNKDVKISYLGPNFEKWFSGMEVASRAGYVLQSKHLTKSLNDKQIMDELGDSCETDLVDIYHLLSLQSNGGDGVLLTNGYANIFYIKDVNGVRRAVSAYWLDGGWGVGARSVEVMSSWLEGRRVFSRNS